MVKQAFQLSYVNIIRGTYNMNEVKNKLLNLMMFIIESSKIIKKYLIYTIYHPSLNELLYFAYCACTAVRVGGWQVRILGHTVLKINL